MRLFELLGDEFFNQDRIRRAENANDKSRDILVYMSPATFLNLAMKRSAPDEDKAARVKEFTDNNEKIDEIPFLEIRVEGDKAYVTGHEGRHRSDYLLSKGVDLMPVIITTNNIRWGCQTNPNMKYDYLKVWPETLTSENGETFKFPFERDAYFKDPKDRFKLSLNESVETGGDDVSDLQRVFGGFTFVPEVLFLVDPARFGYDDYSFNSGKAINGHMNILGVNGYDEFSGEEDDFFDKVAIIGDNVQATEKFIKDNYKGTPMIQYHEAVAKYTGDASKLKRVLKRLKVNV